MPGTAAITQRKSGAALHSALAAAAVTLLKLAAGLLTGSLGMLSDAAHSGVDLLGAALTLLAVRISDKPADEDHPYGHGKIENVSAFVQCFLMLASAVWITAEAGNRIFLHPVPIQHSVWPILVAVLSITVDVWRSRRLRHMARELGSHALEADAVHFASDIWSSAAVFTGLLAAWLGSSSLGRQHHLQWLDYADPVAAIAVSVMILFLSYKLARRTVAVLLDAIPVETRRRVLNEVRATDGVLAIDQARMRRAGNGYFADMTLSLPRQLTFQKTEELVRDATRAVHRVLPGADVVIHTVPRSTLAESIFDKVRAVAARNNIVLHDVSIQACQGALRVEQHMELDENLPLKTAHDFVRRIEDEIRGELPQVASVLTHIESQPATIEQPETLARDRRIEAELRRAAATLPQVLDIHDVLTGRIGDKLQLSCHCTLPDALPMQQVHTIITELEDRFKLHCPEVHRVLIHPEPATDNHHH